MKNDSIRGQRKIRFTLFSIASLTLLAGTLGATHAFGTTKNTASHTAQQGTQPKNATRRTAPAPAHTLLNVYYAGSMTQVMEQAIGPQFDKMTGDTYQGKGMGSVALAQMMRNGLGQPDVFISAAPSVNTSLLMGKANHNLETWYITLAKDQLVIAYNPTSRYAKDLRLAASHRLPWYSVLEQKGFRLGRTDPTIDPKGVMTVEMLQLAERFYHNKTLSSRIIGSALNPKQIFPEEALLAQLKTGQVDAAVAFLHEAKEWHVPYITLPNAINLGDPAESAFYHNATWTQKGKTSHAEPIVFTISIPTNAKHKAAAIAFVNDVLSGPANKILLREGFTAMPHTAYGLRSAIPTVLQKDLTPTKGSVHA